MSRGSDLMRLQEVDALLARDGERLRSTEALIERDPELETMRRDARRARRSEAAAQARLVSAERDADALRGRARELDRHLYDGSVGNPKELLGMQHDLASLRSRIAAADDELLELMETAESAASAAREANARVVAREGERAGLAGELEETAVALRAAVEQHQRDRAALVASIPAADAALYSRLATRLRPAVVRVSGDACGGCHLPFAPAQLRRIRVGDEPVQCSECDRVVVP